MRTESVPSVAPGSPSNLLSALQERAGNDLTQVISASVLIGLVAFLVWSAIKAGRRPPRRSGWTPRLVMRSDRRDPQPDVTYDPTRQLDAIARVAFKTRPLMNKTEYAVYRKLEKILPALPETYRLLSQTSMGELLDTSTASGSESERAAGFAAINAKRVDFALIDHRGHIALAIEVQGSGHHLGKAAFVRDAVKREAFRKAGVFMLEVLPEWTEDELQRQVRTYLSSHVSAPKPGFPRRQTDPSKACASPFRQPRPDPASSHRSAPSHPFRQRR